MITVDMGKRENRAGVEAGYGLIVPEGKYSDGKVFFCQERKTKGGEDMLCIGFKTGIVSGTVFHNLVIPREGCRSGEVTEFMLGQVSSLLGFLGMPNTGKLSLSEADFIGKETGIVVFHEVYEGKKRAKIKHFFDKKIDTSTAEQDRLVEEIADFPF